MKPIKYFATSVFIILVLFLFIANFSSADFQFQCSGKIATKNNLRDPVTIYMKLNKYRWWVSAWSNSNGALWLEIPNVYIGYYGHLIKVEDRLQIFDLDKKLKGNFSTLSKTLALSTPAGFFDGVCKNLQH